MLVDSCLWCKCFQIIMCDDTDTNTENPSEEKLSLDGWRYESHYGGARLGSHFETPDTLKLEFAELDDSRYLKKFHLKPDQRYIAIVHAVGENIESQDGVGANICINGTWQHSSDFKNGMESFDGDFTLRFKTPDTGEVEIGLRLGFWCSEAKGAVTFSNLRLVLDDQWVIFGTDQIRIEMSFDVMAEIDVDYIMPFLDRISKVYDAMGNLYGSYPFNHEPVYYETRRGVRCWAFAGNPIVWSAKCCIDYFKSLEKHPFKSDNACFGAIHEMGHNFEQSIISELNHETIANFALCYAVEKLNLPIVFDNEQTFGRGLQDGFYKRCYLKSIKKLEYNHDGMLYCILRIKDYIGWEPFETFLRNVIREPPKIKKKSEILKYWFDQLSEISEKDVKDTFEPNEYDFLLSQEKY